MTEEEAKSMGDLFPDLGPEAVAALEVEDFPAIVVIDSTGDNYYETGQAPYRKL